MTTRRMMLGAVPAALAGAPAVTKKSELRESQKLPSSWKWDTSIRDFASLKQNVMKYAAVKGPSVAVMSIMGDIEHYRQTIKVPWLAQQSPLGWLRNVDSLVIKGPGYMPFHEMMIRQRDRIAECVHLKLVPANRFKYMDALTANPAAMVTWIETLDWKFPWGVGNIDMDTAYALAFDWKVMRNERAHDALVTWFDWHDKHFDSKTGYWDFGNTGELRNCMAGAMHQYGMYFMLGKELKYVERAVDATLSLQEPTGLFAVDSFSNNCLDIDAVFILSNIYNRYGVRQAKIRTALERAFEANLKCFHPDGGAVHRAGIDTAPEWWSTWCRIAIVGWSARILGIKEYDGPWDFRPRHPFKSEDGGKSLPSWTSDAWHAAADWPLPKSA